MVCGHGGTSEDGVQPPLDSNGMAYTGSCHGGLNEVVQATAVVPGMGCGPDGAQRDCLYGIRLPRYLTRLFCTGLGKNVIYQRRVCSVPAEQQNLVLAFLCAS